MKVRSTVLAVGQYVGRWVSWVEQNKAGLAACGSAVGAIYNGIVNGADAMTLALAVGTLIGLATHLTSTPLSNPKTAQGVPLIPSSLAQNVTVTSDAPVSVQVSGTPVTVKTTDNRLALLPAPHPSGKRTGAVITHDRRDYKPGRLKAKTADVSGAWRTILAALKVMLLNDRLGDCTIAAFLKLVAILLTIAGRPIPRDLLTDATALRLYEQWDGYVAGQQDTDQGGDPREVLKAGQKIGIDGVKVGTFAAVPTGDLAAIRAALRAHGALYSALYLPDDYDRMGFRWIVQRGNKPDPNEGHAVVVVMFGGKFFALTWGGVATVSPSFLTGYFAQHFAVDGLAA